MVAAFVLAYVTVLAMAPCDTTLASLRKDKNIPPTIKNHQVHRKSFNVNIFYALQSVFCSLSNRNRLLWQCKIALDKNALLDICMGI